MEGSQSLLYELAGKPVKKDLDKWAAIQQMEMGNRAFRYYE